MTGQFDQGVLSAIGPLTDAGFCLHWLHPRQKRPIGDDWSTKPFADAATLRRRHSPGNNLGVRLGLLSAVGSGYLHVIDLDIREWADPAEAHAELAGLGFPSLKGFPSVISGSGGASRHVYFISDKHFSSKKLLKSPGFRMVFDPAKGRDVKKHDWEIELFGTGKQVAMPPSIHPDTGLPYRWEVEFDFAMLALGIEPFISAAAIEKVGISEHVEVDPADIKPRLGLEFEEAEKILSYLPLDFYCEDRDGWVQVGMALHHEFGDDGYDLWCEFAQQSPKYDEKTQKTVWKSFKEKPNSIRMASLKAVANAARLQDAFDEEDDEDEDDDSPVDPAQVADYLALLNDGVAGAGEKDPFDALLEAALNGGAPQAAENGPVDPLDAIFDTASTPAAATNGLHWTSLLQINEEGAVKATLHNLELICKNDPRLAGLAQYNQFKQETVQRRDPGRKRKRRETQPKEVRQLEGPMWTVQDKINGDLWSDSRDAAIRSILEAPETQGGYGIKISDRDLRSAIDLAALDSGFHPVREYLESLTWDGTPRAETLFIDYLGSPDNSYHRSTARLMLIGAVTRIFEPGHKFDFAVILEGLQGKRKSTFVETLGRKWFAELDGDFHDTKQMVELMQGAWIMEIPELTGFSRADVRAIKAFISRREDKARLAYDRRARVFPRQAIFVGSTNDSEYLRDDTGGRRFWPTKCNIAEIPIEHLSANVDQIWAEALALYRGMRETQPYGTLPLYLTDREAHKTATALQESRRVETAADGLAGQIASWLARPINSGGMDDDDTGPERYRDRTCLKEIHVECLGNLPGHYDNAKSQLLGSAMRKVDGWVAAGWEEFPIYGRQRAYHRGEAEAEPT